MLTATGLSTYNIFDDFRVPHVCMTSAEFNDCSAPDAVQWGEIVSRELGVNNMFTDDVHGHNEVFVGVL